MDGQPIVGKKKKNPKKKKKDETNKQKNTQVFSTLYTLLTLNTGACINHMRRKAL